MWHQEAPEVTEKGRKENRTAHIHTSKHVTVIKVYKLELWQLDKPTKKYKLMIDRMLRPNT